MDKELEQKLRNVKRKVKELKKFKSDKKNKKFEPINISLIKPILEYLEIELIDKGGSHIGLLYKQKPLVISLPVYHGSGRKKGCLDERKIRIVYIDQLFQNLVTMLELKKIINELFGEHYYE